MLICSMEAWNNIISLWVCLWNSFMGFLFLLSNQPLRKALDLISSHEMSPFLKYIFGHIGHEVPYFFALPCLGQVPQRATLFPGNCPFPSFLHAYPHTKWDLEHHWCGIFCLRGILLLLPGPLCLRIPSLTPQKSCSLTGSSALTFFFLYECFIKGSCGLVPALTHYQPWITPCPPNPFSMGNSLPISFTGIPGKQQRRVFILLYCFQKHTNLPKLQPFLLSSLL